jgi:hypothetical protein
MVHNIQNHWILDFGHRPVFQKLENTTFRKLYLFSSSGEGGRKTPTQLGPLERANFNPPCSTVSDDYIAVVNVTGVGQ